MRVLLIEEGWHSTLYLARALESAGHAVTVLTANGSRARHRHKTVLWTSGPTLGSDAFLPHVERVVTGGGIERVFPLTELAMSRLWDTPGVWSDRLHPATEEWQRRLLRDKHALVEHMATRGIAIPVHRRLDDATAARLQDVALPAVIKGATGAGGRMVSIVESRAALGDAVRRARAMGGEWILQELVAGPTYLFGGLFWRGEPVRIYAGEKVEQHPPRTGSAIRLRSTTDPALLDVGVRTMRELQWTGFASADLMRRADGSYVLLEVNPRLWGSLAGARSAGVDLFTPFAALLGGERPAPALGFAPGADCLIFPRYLNAAAHRNLAGVRQALSDLHGEQGRDWLDPRFVVHTLRRLYHMKRLARRL
ncbi:MAG TPA: ATP-grasp domain-containing protein [Kofleriaceae bacterium]|nr:ATP-grasp domain-containing protein [Kofleriaceae bacterium]